MSPINLIAVSVRLFAIFLALDAIRGFIALAVHSTPEGGDKLTVGVAAIATFAITIFLWKFPLTVAKRLYPESEIDQTHPWNRDDLYIAGFAILGLYWLGRSLTGVAYWRAYFFYVASEVPQPALSLS